MKKWRYGFAGIVSALALGGLAPSNAATGAGAEGLKRGETGHVVSIVDGDTFFLSGDLKVRLAGIQTPKLPLGREGFKAWPLGEEAKTALADLISDKKLGLYYGGETRDRYGRALAQVFILDAKNKPVIWVQEAMVAQGMARVYTWPDTSRDIKRLYTAERSARTEHLGIWGHPFYAVRSPEPNALSQDMDSFQIVEGIITSVADVRGRVYLNFGADYKTDFTIAIAKKNRKRFEKSGLDPLSLEGAKVRARGWVEMTNGPMMWMDHPERLEVLD